MKMLNKRAALSKTSTATVKKKNTLFTSAKFECTATVCEPHLKKHVESIEYLQGDTHKIYRGYTQDERQV